MSILRSFSRVCIANRRFAGTLILFLFGLTPFSLLLMTYFQVIEKAHRQADMVYDRRHTRLLPFPDEVRDLASLQCSDPDLDPFSPSVWDTNDVVKIKSITCGCAFGDIHQDDNVTDDWVYVTNGTLRFSQQALNRFGAFTCVLSPLLRVTDFETHHEPRVKMVTEGYRLPTDFFKAACVSNGGVQYLNIHAAVAWNPLVHRRLKHHQDNGVSGFRKNMFDFV